MDHKQIGIIMEVIYTNYQNQLNKLDSNKYYNNLKFFLADEDFEKVSRNLKRHIKESSYPPNIKELVWEDKDVLRGIPDSNETQKYIESLEERKKNALPQEVSLKYINEIKRLLGEIDNGWELTTTC